MRNRNILHVISELIFRILFILGMILCPLEAVALCPPNSDPQDQIEEKKYCLCLWQETGQLLAGIRDMEQGIEQRNEDPEHSIDSSGRFSEAYRKHDIEEQRKTAIVNMNELALRHCFDVLNPKQATPAPAEAVKPAKSKLAKITSLTLAPMRLDEKSMTYVKETKFLYGYGEAVRFVGDLGLVPAEDKANQPTVHYEGKVLAGDGQALCTFDQPNGSHRVIKNGGGYAPAIDAKDYFHNSCQYPFDEPCEPLEDTFEWGSCSPYSGAGLDYLRKTNAPGSFQVVLEAFSYDDKGSKVVLGKAQTAFTADYKKCVPFDLANRTPKSIYRDCKGGIKKPGICVDERNVDGAKGVLTMLKYAKGPSGDVEDKLVATLDLAMELPLWVDTESKDVVFKAKLEGDRSKLDNASIKIGSKSMDLKTQNTAPPEDKVSVSVSSNYKERTMDCPSRMFTVWMDQSPFTFELIFK